MQERLSFVEGLLARLQGPLALRFVIQPLVAAVFAIRDGLRDAKEGKKAYFWALFSDTGHRREMLESGWRSIGKVIVVAGLIDLVFQQIVFGRMRLEGALWAGLILALGPYLVVRGPVGHLGSLWARRGTG
jgi:hypothetical protein